MILFTKTQGCAGCTTVKPHIPPNIEVVQLDTEDGMAMAAFHEVYSVPQLKLEDGTRLTSVKDIVAMLKGVGNRENPPQSPFAKGEVREDCPVKPGNDKHIDPGNHSEESEVADGEG